MLDRLEALYENHEETDVAAAVMRGYAHAERYLGGDDTDFLSRAETLYSSHPDGDVAVGLAGVLAGRTNTDAAQEDVESIERRIARIETLAQQYPAVEAEIVRWLPIAAANVTRISFELPITAASSTGPGRRTSITSVSIPPRAQPGRRSRPSTPPAPRCTTPRSRLARRS
ncbi:hypothetical protein ACFQH2_01690 [Natronoarchaeum sp. GCM10025703]|uniref:hypothetical protein n=1 Tax=Natronoarchaeum sp. GCM10025703 TaxID=3252685 RepID=UPI003620A8F9